MGSPVPNEDLEGDMPMDEPMGDPMGDEASDKPFDDTPFDAGVEANEDENPEKYIQQLSGKLGQSLRAYTDEMGSPDYDLEKFAINSVLSATNSGEMDNEDQVDIIKKVKSSSTDGASDDLGNAEEPIDDNGGETEPDGGETELDLDAIDMEEGHNPNPHGRTVFQDLTLGVKDGGMEENKYLNLENTKKSDIFVNDKQKIKDMIKENLMSKLTESPEPKVKPAEPIVKPSRRANPFRPPMIEEDPQPKAMDREPITYISHGGLQNVAHEFELTFDVGGVRFVADFENTGDALSTPMAYDEPWAYSFETDVLSNGKRYGVTAEFLGHSETNLEFSGFEGDGNPIIEEL